MWKKPSLAEQVADYLEGKIINGDFLDFLPGENSLTKLTGVSRSSIREALKILEGKGLIESSQGKNRKILATAASQSSSFHATLLIPTTLYEMGSPFIKLIAETEKQLQSSVRLDILTSRAIKMQRPKRHLQRLVSSTTTDLWILVQASPATQRWLQKQDIPCVVMGSSLEDIDFASIDVDWAETGLHLANLIAQHNHHHVYVVERHIQAQGSKLLKKAYTQRFEQLDIKVESGFPEYGVIPLLEKYLTTKLSKSQIPTVIVFYEYDNLLTGITWMMSNGLKIPEDISVICLDADESIDSIYPAITHYRRNIPPLIKALVNTILTSLGEKPISRQLATQQKYIKGASLKKC